MIPALILVHAAIALLAVATSRVATPQRGRFAQALAVTGGAMALLLFFASPVLEESWRTLAIDEPGTRIAGIAVAAAWILVAVSERSRGGGRWDVVAATGVASTALFMYALNEWAIPALLFAGIAALATAVSFGRPGAATGLLALATAVAGGALIWESLHTETWQLPVPLSGPRLWVGIAGAVAFSVAAVVAESADRPPPATPLALGLAFATLGSIARGAGPVVAVAILAVAFLAVVRTLATEAVAQRVVLVWVVALSVALAALSSSVYVVATSAVAAVLAATALRLWPLSLGRAQTERGIVVAFVAMTAGFNAIAAAAAFSFERSIAIERVVEATPWAAVSALLPVALAGGVVLGAAVGTNAEPEEYTRSGVLGSWVVVVLTIVVGLFPYVLPDHDAGLAGPGLYVAALIAGIAAARYRLLGATPPLHSVDSRFLDVPLRLPWPRPAVVAARIVGGIVTIAIVAATFHGLRVGFL